jgi:sec-independent protein translocase protein TatA
MGLDNPLHIAFLLILLLLVFGAKRLPEIGRSLGTGMRGFKEALSDTKPSPTPQRQEPVTTAAATSAGTRLAGPADEPVAAPTAERE